MSHRKKTLNLEENMDVCGDEVIKKETNEWLYFVVL